MDLAATNDDWETLGREDPFWAVYVAPGRRDGGWDIRAFLETGRVEVERVLSRVRELVPAAGRDHALDFGCGVGRLSLPLSTHFTHVTGVDASPTMLALAREIAGQRCEFVLNRAPDLARFGDASVDLAYSSLVLQHLPRENALLYVRELVRITHPSGCIVVQVASRPDWSAKGVAARIAPSGLTGWAQRRLLGYPAPMLMTALSDRAVRKAANAAGGTVLAVESDPTYGGHWHYTRYYLAPSRSQPC